MGDTMDTTEPSKGFSDRPVCQICQTDTDLSTMVALALVRPAVVEAIRKDEPGLSLDGFICKDDLNRYRLRYVQSLLSSEQGEITTLDRDVLESLKQHEFLTSNLKAELEIRHLHEKVDHLLSRQWERLFEIQQIQIELLSEVAALKKNRD